jgi:acetylornithine/succinyldiaminopimelate/putrescine aminotransferase
MGLRTPEPEVIAAKLAANGVLAVPSFDDDVVPFRPVLTLTDNDADAIIDVCERR